MNVYVESNFVLELVRVQEQYEACSAILERAESGAVHLVIPAFSLAEPHWTLVQFGKRREVLRKQLDAELRDLSRTETYSERLEGFKDLTSLLIRSADEEAHRLSEVQARILRIAEAIPLDASVLMEASRIRETTTLPTLDAIVYASVVSHLSSSPAAGESLFLNRDGHFEDPVLVAELVGKGCKLIGSFVEGLRYLRRDAAAS